MRPTLTVSHLRRSTSWTRCEGLDPPYYADNLALVYEVNRTYRKVLRLCPVLPHPRDNFRNLLRRCGFSEEGLARKYLNIAGKWQDHLLFAKLSEGR